jgi:hypothetical protein
LPRREGGVFSVLAAVLILVILGLCGFALDLSRTYNRKAELQSAADAIALAAAAELDGTAAGITRARAAALEASARNATYDYTSFIEWSEDALRFSAAPSGSNWIEAGAADAQAARMFFVEVDTGRLDAGYGRINMLLIQVLSPALKTADIRSRAVAGRSTISALPLAICAMTDTPDPAGVARAGGELVELGFRRGISYNLMNLNPQSNASAANFLINPVAPAGSAGAAVGTRLDVIEPFICTGTLGIPALTGGTITVEPGFPLGDVFKHLNSRFGDPAPPCTSATAPPDTNVKEFTPAVVAAWMTDTPLQSAKIHDPYTRRVTIADLAAADLPATTKAEQYGPLWIYARAAKAENYKNGVAEPSGGYTTFATADWPTLYPKGTPNLEAAFPSPAPYRSAITPPTGGLTGLAGRRVLNVPLLRCPVPAGAPAPAEVVGIGKFYMTVRATKDELIGEFAGLVRQEQLTGQVELYR